MIRIAAQITTGLLVLSLSNLAFAEPVLYRAVYKADYKGLPVSAKGIRELSRSDDGTYTLSSTATSFFTKIVEVSKFKLVDEQVVPVEYQYHRSGIGKKRDAILSFDWENSKVLNNVQSKPWEMSIPEGTLDKLLYQLKMREDLVAARKEGLPWPTLDYQVADGGRPFGKRKLEAGIEQAPGNHTYELDDAGKFKDRGRAWRRRTKASLTYTRRTLKKIGEILKRAKRYPDLQVDRQEVGGYQTRLSALEKELKALRYIEGPP